MSSAQRLEKMGALEEKRQQAIALSVEIYYLREEINRATDRSRSIESLALDELSVLMQRLQEKTAEHRQLVAELHDLAGDLGVPMPMTDVRRKR